ncbi:MAG TPA: cysteine peptidase family C39 domain-containing protein [Mobilitalea sp.]|nr:cysteine peptidase family C39 domain-containing protein [Mobilitalea sp.]
MWVNPDKMFISDVLNNTCHHFIPVPLCFQETEYTCGVACVQSILAYYGIVYKQDVLAEMLKQKPIYGTEYHNILSFMQMLGFQASFHIDMTIDLVKSCTDYGITPILMIQAWKDDPIDYTADWRDSHYAIACGYDENRIIFMDPYTLGNYTYISNEELLKRWHLVDPNGYHYYFTGLIIKSDYCPVAYNPYVIKYQG